MNITFVCSSLGSGGAERVLLTLAEGLAAREHAVSILTFSSLSRDFYDIPNGVRRLSLDFDKPILVLLGLFSLRKAIRSTKPDIVISFIDQTNIITLFVTRGLGIPIVVSERIDPAVYSPGKIWAILRAFIYPYADRIVVQTCGALKYFLPQFKFSALVIPNPVLEPIFHLSSRNPQKGHSIIAMGRLEDQKGFDLLLEAFSQLSERYATWTLTILGEGPLRGKLLKLRERLGLTHRVYFPGRVKHPYDVLRAADIFVLSSRFEGFPNALCEAMASGLAVIATDCRSGPSDIIVDGQNGRLVPNGRIDTLSDAMSDLMSDSEQRNMLAAAAPKIVEKFSLETVLDQWELMFLELC